MSYLKRQNGVGAVIEDDIASYMQKLPPIAGRGRSGLSSFVSTSGGYVRTGYVRTGLGAIPSGTIKTMVAKFRLMAPKDIIKAMLKIAPGDRQAVYDEMKKVFKYKNLIDPVIQAAPPGKPSKPGTFATLPSILRSGITTQLTQATIAPAPPSRDRIQVGLTQAQKDAMSPEEFAAYQAKNAELAKANEEARKNAIRVVDHSGGKTVYVRDNTPEGLKAQAEGRLQTVEQGGSGVLTPPTPEQAASPTPVTPDGAQPLTPVAAPGGLFSGPLPWIIGGGVAILGLVLLTRKTGGAKKAH